MPRCYDDADAATKLQISGFREGRTGRGFFVTFFCHRGGGGGRGGGIGDSSSWIVKIDRNAEHLQFIMEMALILLKRRGGKLSFYIKVT